MLTEPLLVKVMESGLKKSGGEFLSFLLRDKCGTEIKAVAWEGIDTLKQTILAGYVYILDVTKSTYQNEPQYTIHSATLAENINAFEFIEESPINIEETYNIILAFLNKVTNPCYRTLLDNIIEALDNEELKLKLFNLSTPNYSYRGGLLKYILDQLMLAKFHFLYFSDIDKELVITAIFCKDLGELYKELQGIMFVASLRQALVGTKNASLDIIKSFMPDIEMYNSEDFIRLEHCLMIGATSDRVMFFEASLITMLSRLVITKSVFDKVDGYRQVKI